MAFHHSGNIKYFTFDSQFQNSIKHAIFTRQGGVSPIPWDSLNVGGYIGDDLENTYINRVRSFEALNRDPNSVYDVWQVHSSDVMCTTGPRPRNVTHKQADAILTDNPKVTLFMRFADCVPIMFFDPVKKVVGIAHAGWRGTVNRIATATVDKMVSEYGCQREEIQTGIGPSIGPDHYEVGAEVIEQVLKSFGKDASRLLQTVNDSTHLDLWQANHILLKNAGINNIEISGICTACHLKDWFSHRAEHGKTGRFGALIALED
jgi:YfiH family protein